MVKNIIIWDLEQKCKIKKGDVHFWASYNKTLNDISIPLLLEKESDNYRNLFLTFIYQLSQSKINNKTLIENLQIKKDFSLWWMNKIFEKNPLKSKRIYDCLKMIVLENILKQNKYDKLILYTKDKKLDISISNLCSSLGLLFECKLKKNKQKKFSLISFFNYLPVALQGLLYFFYYIFKRRHLINRNFNNTLITSKSIFICSYFINFNIERSLKGIFFSSFWNCLPDKLLKNNFKINWIHHLIRNKNFKNTKKAHNIISNINDRNNKNEIHNLLESFLDYQIILKVFFQWFKCIFIKIKTKNITSRFRNKSSNINFWHLLKDDWNSSLYGKDSIHNLFMLELFIKYFKFLPNQKIGLYLYENQPWEMAMLYSWKKYQVAPIIGFAHATVPYWHLYYYNHSNFYKTFEKNNFPTPDYVALNGEFAINNFNLSGFPKDKTFRVEALRYLDAFSDISIKEDTKKNKKMLIVGEMNRASMELMFKIVDDTYSFLQKNKYEIGLKFHPSNILNLDNHNKIYNIETAPLENLFKKYDIIIAGNSTSAALEAFLLNKKLIIILSGSNLNLSPLRDLSEIKFISSGKDLQKALKNYQGFNKINFKLEKYLFLDRKIPKWLSLINNKCLT